MKKINNQAKEGNMVNNISPEKLETLKITTTAKDLLYNLKQRGETYSEVVIRLVEFYDKKKKSD